MSEPQTSPESGPTEPDRRDFLSTASSMAMAGGLLAGYGTLAFMAGRFLYPTKGREIAEVYVTQTNRMKVGDVLRYETPLGQTVTIRRVADNGTKDDFLALSSTCPHLGCQVHWEPEEQYKNQFFCPCHNGVFNADGKAIAGPPAEAGQSLIPYELKVDYGLLFIKVPVERLG